MKPTKFKEVEILEMRFCVVVPTNKAEAFIVAAREKLGEVSIFRGAESAGRGGEKYRLLSIHVPVPKKDQFHILLHDFCQEHDILLSEKTSQY